MKRVAFATLAVLFGWLGPQVASAGYTVLGTANLYEAGTSTNFGGGTLPPSLTVASGEVLNFSVTGSVTLNIGSGTNYNDADGIGSVSTLNVSPYGSLSGISNGHDGFLAGVFVGPGGPSGSPPTSLAFSDNGSNGTIATSFTSLSPLVDQVFFIGDGLTGDGTGSVQQFIVPTGATTLYLGITDAPNYSGSPGSYGDNGGSFNVVVGGVVPEPPSLALVALGAGSILAWVRRRRAA